MSGYYNDTVRMGNLQINTDIENGDKNLSTFLSDKIYKFLPSQTTKFDISYPSRHKHLSPTDCEDYYALSEYTFDYPEGGEGARFPDNVNVSNTRYHKFYDFFLSRPSEEIDDEALTIHLCATHGNCCNECVFAPYQSMHTFIKKNGGYDFNSHPFSKY